jgi:hypothetical protein
MRCAAHVSGASRFPLSVTALPAPNVWALILSVTGVVWEVHLCPTFRILHSPCMHKHGGMQLGGRCEGPHPAGRTGAMCSRPARETPVNADGVRQRGGCVAHRGMAQEWRLRCLGGDMPIHSMRSPSCPATMIAGSGREKRQVKRDCWQPLA